MILALLCFAVVAATVRTIPAEVHYLLHFSDYAPAEATVQQVDEERVYRGHRTYWTLAVQRGSETVHARILDEKMYRYGLLSGIGQADPHAGDRLTVQLSTGGDVVGFTFASALTMLGLRLALIVYIWSSWRYAGKAYDSHSAFRRAGG